MRKAADGESSTLDEIASIVEKLAVLLSAGIAPSAAWRYLADSASDARHSVVAVVSNLESGVELVEAILRAADEELAQLDSKKVGPHRTVRRASDTAWRGLAAAWVVATEAGAPLAQSLREFSSSLRALAQSARAATTALSGPAATAKLVMVLPIVGVLFGIALGFDTVGTLIGTTPGLVCLGAGCALLWTARWWNRKLVRAATPTDLTPGLMLDLLAVAVSGGASIAKARATVMAAFERSGCAADSHDVVEADAVFDLSQRAGIPAGILLRSEADRVRREASSAAERKAETLAVTLMLPLGLCVLPAFMLLGVAPLMISVLSSTVIGF